MRQRIDNIIQIFQLCCNVGWEYNLNLIILVLKTNKDDYSNKSNC